MDLLQDQVSILSNKVDGLQKLVKQLETQTIEVLSEIKGIKGGANSSQATSSIRQISQARMFDGEMEHKDVLSDFTTYPESDSQSGERTLSPEVQIQRLTAQLTAAYNRIAALEEQLLAKRIH